MSKGFEIIASIGLGLISASTLLIAICMLFIISSPC